MSLARIAASLALIAALGAGVASAAAPPNKIEYHGYATNGGGLPLDGAYKVRLSLFPAASGGAAVWTETQDPVTFVGGAFSLLMGTNTALPPSLFDGTPLWIETAIADTTLSPRRPLATVPYAFHSTVADTARTLTLGGPSVFHLADTRPGCPPTSPPSGIILTQNLNLGATAPVNVHAMMARFASGRADLTLVVDGSPVMNSIAHTASAEGSAWATAHIQWSGNLSAGIHTISLQVAGNTAAWGCGSNWGAIDTIVLR